MEREKKENNIKFHHRHLTYLNSVQLNLNNNKTFNTQLNLSNNIKKENKTLKKLVADYELKNKQYEIEEKKQKIKMYKNQFLNNKYKFNENSLIIKELKDNIKNEINRSLLIRNNTNHEKSLSNISNLKRKTLLKSNQNTNSYSSFPKNINTSNVKKNNVKKNDIYSSKNISQTSRSNSKVQNKSSDISVLKNKKEKKKECNLTMNDKSNFCFDDSKSFNLVKNEKEKDRKNQINEKNLKDFQKKNKTNTNKINPSSSNNHINQQLKKSTSRKSSKHLAKNNSVGNVRSLYSSKPNQSVIINNYNSFNYINVNNNNKIEVKQNKKIN